MYMKAKKITTKVAVLVVAAAFTLSGCGKSNNLVNSKPDSNASPVQVVNTPNAKVIVDTADNYIGQVGSEKITQSEFYFFLKQTKNEMEGNANPTGTSDMSKFWTTKIDGKDPKEQAKETTLQNMQEYKILINEAKKSGITLTDKDKEEINNTFTKLLSENGGEQAVSVRMQQEYGISFAQYKEIYNSFKLNEKYMKEKQKDIAVTDEEVLKYYNENKVKLDAAVVNHVLFMTIDQATNQPLPQDKQDEAKKKADEILAKVNAGEDIKALAKQFSQDPGVTQNEGEYTVRKDGQMVKEFEDWTFSHKVGDTGIVKTTYGYHVMKKVHQATEDEAKQGAKSEVQNSKLVEQLNKLKSEDKYKVVKNDAVFAKLEI